MKKKIFTYDCRKEATGAKCSEGKRQRKRSNEEYCRQEEDVGDSVGDMWLTTGHARQVPALFDTLVLANAVFTHLDTFLVCQTVLIQLV